MATIKSDEVKGVSFEMIAAVTSLSVVFSSLIGGAITIESRYAKASDVKTWVSDSYEKINEDAVALLISATSDYLQAQITDIQTRLNAAGMALVNPG